MIVFGLGLVFLDSLLVAQTNTPYWLAPPGVTNNYTTDILACTSTLPLRWNLNQVRQIIATNPKAPTNAGVILYFTPGRYDIGHLGVPSETPGQRRLTLTSWDLENPAELRFAHPPGRPAHPAGHLFSGWSGDVWMLDFELDTSSAPEGFAYFEASHLVLNANWPAWASTNTPASPAWPDGLKLMALRVRGQRGWLHHLRLLNCGANGVVPQPYWRVAGTEAFPLMVNATVFPTDDAPLWRVEDCEVSDFHTRHGGYGTAIMVNTPNDVNKGTNSLPYQFPGRRAAVVQRNQVRGDSRLIALGSAGSAGVSFRDNVAVGVGVGLNHDTGLQRNMDLTNNVFLDVDLMANVGAPLWPASHFTNYTIAGNLARLPACRCHRTTAISRTSGSPWAARTGAGCR